MKNLGIIAGLIFNFIKKNISNICLFLGAFLIIRYMAIVYSYDVATLGVACMLFLVSISTSYSEIHNKKEKNNQRVPY